MATLDSMDKEGIEQYIDELHDRIEFLEEELQLSERNLLEERASGSSVAVV